MNLEQRLKLIDYYKRIEQESIDLKHRIYNRDMKDYLLNKRTDVRFSDDYASYIVMGNEVFNGWQEAADYMGMPKPNLMQSYYRNNQYEVRMIKTTDKPERQKNN